MGGKVFHVHLEMIAINLKKTQKNQQNTTQQEKQKSRGNEHHVVLFLVISKFTYFLLKEDKVSMVTVSLFIRGYREHLALKDMNTLGMRFSFCCRFIIFPMPYDSDHLF